MTSVFVTAGTSQLGQLTVESLLPDVERGTVKLSVSVRNESKVPATWKEAGILVKTIDYTASANEWAKALTGVERVLLISSNSGIGPDRVQQHRNIIDGARQARVNLLAYTSILNIESHNMALAEDHRATEAYIKQAGVPYVLLRNGWYTENWFLGRDAWKPTGTLTSAAGQAKFSAAPRIDYAEAAAAVLRPSFERSNVAFELGGAEGFTLDAYAQAVSDVLGFPLKHVSLPPQQYREVLVTHAGLPEQIADVFVDADRQAEEKAALYTERDDLAKLIGRAPTPFKAVLQTALRA